MDEAIALGAIYQAARVTKNFIVKRFEAEEPSCEPLSAEQAKLVISEDEIKAGQRM